MPWYTYFHVTFNKRREINVCRFLLTMAAKLLGFHCTTIKKLYIFRNFGDALDGQTQISQTNFISKTPYPLVATLKFWHLLGTMYSIDPACAASLFNSNITRFDGAHPCSASLDISLDHISISAISSSGRKPDHVERINPSWPRCTSVYQANLEVVC